MPNRLADEQSPYLRQHKDNPVDWYPWGEEAFQKAEEEDKPIFLSIGYSTCHWCHVMAHESFEDEDVAEMMNETFVSIKVDREERPDVDTIYMNVCQMMRGQGGWPLTVLLTPDRKPFYAATYLPKEGRFQQMGMMDLVPRIQQMWENERDRLLEDADEVTSLLQRSVDESGGTEAPDEEVLDEAFQQLSREFDDTHGGFGSAPKFPAPHNLLFLLRQWHRTGEDRALEVVTETLDQMRLGGIFDQVGYGFHRYSTDERWVLPHFEKMLYDQAMHVLAYTEAAQATGEKRYEQTAREVLTYVLRDLQAPEGGFYSAEDADSPNEEGEMEEGAFYVWSVEEVRELLDEETSELLIDLYNMTPEGNYQEEATGKRTGKNVLYLNRSLEEEAKKREMVLPELRSTLEEARATLVAHRDKRPRPGLDDKVLTDWNGLMIAALATAARVFDEPEYEQAATDAAAFVLDTLRDEDGTLLHRYREGEAGVQAHLDDYAFLVWGLIELYETTFEVEWLEAAIDLMDESIAQFWDEEDGGFFLTSTDGEELIVRPKELSDGAKPSGNSVHFSNLIRLARLTGRTQLEERADALARWAGRQSRSRPTGFTALLAGLQFALASSREVVVAGEVDGDDMQALVEVLRSTYDPFSVIVHRPPGDRPAITDLAPFTEDQTPRDGQAAAYVCRDFQCEAPTTDPGQLREQLSLE
ncbi:thioredoxin domain-containing protein [Salinibacter sp. 10B]|uniref:thioredoxin domain-containing protein n=1 Tax=Salinibacter sp. 10B TaxID=1923971 RepID=UPI000CF56CC7|nr:thioredoxin domain-containing protein [Salinibacter sp. 10B]PQJ33531.1 thioredoxin domain-containing protein [Salinibacter sp. 10B]